MNKLIGIGVGVVGIVGTLAASAGSAGAQVHAAQPVPPRGSYSQSCLVRSFDGRTLNAQCNDSRGMPRGTSLDIGPCGAADIENHDGQLRCSTGPVPQGAWRALCPDAWVYGSELRAYCRRTFSAVYSSLKFGTCVGPIGVVGTGRLSCDQGKPAPPGSYRQTCTVVSWDGDNLQMESAKKDGTPNFNQLWRPGECTGDIYNQDGIPFCSRGALPPAGSYQASCSDVRRDGDKLFASCRSADGRFTLPTSLASIAACGGRDIQNTNGKLECAPPPPPPPPPAATPAPAPTLRKPVPAKLRGEI